MEPRQLQVFTSFEDADRATREERWAMTPMQRLAILEQLRRDRYPNGNPPGFERVLEVAERP